MSTYKIRKIDEQNIVDICTNHSTLSRIYDFLKLNNIDYTFANALEEDFITVDDSWIAPQNQYLITNNKVVVSGDDDAYYPNTEKAISLKYSKNILENFTFTNSGTSWHLGFDFRNYGYGNQSSLIYVIILTGSTVIDSRMFNLKNAYGEAIHKDIFTTIPANLKIDVKIYSEYGDITYSVEGDSYGFTRPPENIDVNVPVDMNVPIENLVNNITITYDEYIEKFTVPPAQTGWTMVEKYPMTVEIGTNPSGYTGGVLTLNITDLNTFILTTHRTDILNTLQAVYPLWELYTPENYYLYDTYSDGDGNVWGNLHVAQAKWGGESYYPEPYYYYIIIKILTDHILDFTYLKCQPPVGIPDMLYQPAYADNYPGIVGKGYYNYLSGNPNPYGNFLYENLNSYVYGDYIVSNIFTGRLSCLAQWNNPIPHIYGYNYYHGTIQSLIPHFSIFNKSTNKFSYYYLYYILWNSINLITWEKIFFLGKYIYAITRNYSDVLHDIDWQHDAGSWVGGVYDYFNWGKNYVRRYDVTKMVTDDVIFGAFETQDPPYPDGWEYSGEMIIKDTVDLAYTTKDNRLVMVSSGISYIYDEDGYVTYGVPENSDYIVDAVIYENPSNIPIGAADYTNSELSGQTSGSTSDGMLYVFDNPVIILSQDDTYTGHTWYMSENIDLDNYTVGIGDKIEVNFKYRQDNYEHFDKWSLYAINSSGEICSNIVLLPFGNYSNSSFKTWLALNYLADNDFKIVVKLDDSITNGLIKITNIEVLLISVFKTIYKDFTQKIFYT